VKRWIVIVLLFCLTGTAYANPIIVYDPLNILAYVLVLGSAFVIEAGIVTLILLFWGTDPKPVYKALIVGNLAIYFVVFLPLLDFTSKVWIAEGVIVGLDGLMIKMITLFETFQDDTFRPLRWGYAFLIAAVGNVVSFYVGVATSG
jgi:hypothetical protein